MKATICFPNVTVAYKMSNEQEQLLQQCDLVVVDFWVTCCRLCTLRHPGHESEIQHLDQQSTPLSRGDWPYSGKLNFWILLLQQRCNALISVFPCYRKQLSAQCAPLELHVSELV